MPERNVDVAVIGAGQAGLAAGYHLRQSGLEFLILEGAARPGDSWRNRYNSLTLFTPRAFSQLPGKRLAGDPGGYPSRDEFADYLQEYATALSLPVVNEMKAEGLTLDSGGFRIRTQEGNVILSRAVIVATGGFQKSVRPALATGFSAAVAQFDHETYRAPDSVPQGRVLVVGDGASGRDIAVELAATHQTFLAVGKPRKLFPERIMGRSVWWWLRTAGLMRVKGNSVLGRMMRNADPFPDRGRNFAAMRKKGVRILPRLVGANSSTALFADGTAETVDSVVWAVGYRDDFGWLEIAGAKDRAGNVLHDEGRSPIQGLYFLGRPWQRNRASALVMGASDDAEKIVWTITARQTA